MRGIPQTKRGRVPGNKPGFYCRDSLLCFIAGISACACMVYCRVSGAEARKPLAYAGLALITLSSLPKLGSGACWVKVTFTPSPLKSST